MFNPDQVRAWKDLLATRPEYRETYHGHRLGSVALRLDGDAEPESAPIPRGRLNTPAHIFGTPFDVACLHAIESRLVEGRPARRVELDDAMAIGNDALVAGDGTLHLTGRVTAANAERLLSPINVAHNGFMMLEDDGETRLYFRQLKEPRRWDKKAIFLSSMEAGNYGSFMFRQLPQLIAAHLNGEKADCYIVPDRTTFLIEAMRLFGLPQRPVFTLREISGDRFRSIVKYQMDDGEGFIAPDILDTIRSVAERVAGSVGKAPERIYVSRALGALRAPAYRVMQNEAEVECAVEARGYAVMHPESLSFAGQMRAFHRASRVIGPSGSGMFNILFAPGIARVVDIESHANTVRQHAKMYSAAGADYAFLFTQMSPDDSSGPISRAHHCPMPLLEQALDWLQ